MNNKGGLASAPDRKDVLRRVCAQAAVVVTCLHLAACTNNSSTSGQSLPPPPFKTVVEDHFPSGQRIDVSAQNLFPMNVGDAWNYNIVNAGGTQTGHDSRQVTSGPDVSGRVALTENEAGITDTTNYIVGGDGLLLVAPLEIAPSTAARIIGSIFEYPTPLYPPGATRRHVRSGLWGEDLDGDGVGESFRFEFSQVFLGFETVEFNALSLTYVAHFRNVLQLTLRPTAPGNADYTITATEEAWFAPNLGMVKAARSTVDSDGASLDPVHTLLFSSAIVSGVHWSTSAPPPVLDGQVVDVHLVHNALVYDGVRNRYYASVPGSVSGKGNSIATIEPVTGQVTYSAPIGSEPNALAIAADARSLYVGLDGSGDVVRLALPTMTELGRVHLPSAQSFGQGLARTIAVSPTDPAVVAVSMGQAFGDALLRAMVIQPRSATHHPFTISLAFDADGTTVYGRDDLFVIFRMRVLADGLAEDLMVNEGGAPFVGQSLGTSSAFGNGRYVAGNVLFDAPGLTEAGLISGASDCWPQRSGSLLLCLTPPDVSTAQARLLIADSDSFVIQASLLFSAGEPSFTLRRVVEGPAGQVAISYTTTVPGVISKIRLFSSAQLLTPPTPPSVSWPVTSSTTPDGQALDVGLLHNALVYDSSRDKYYATVPGSVIGAGNSIATVDPATGQVTHSAPIGSEPRLLEIAADGSVLYVTLDGSGEIVKLALPSLTELGRVRLPVNLLSQQPRAKALAVSPTDPGVVAVTGGYGFGVALLRDMVTQPKRTSLFDGNDLLAFDSLGGTLYGVDSFSTPSALRSFQVLADGLADQLVISGPTYSFGTRALGFANNRVIAGNALFDAAALTPAGVISGASDCWPQPTSTQVLCLGIAAGQGRVLVADSRTFAIGASLVYAASEPNPPRRLVHGPAGHIATSYLGPFSPPTIRLFSSSQLP